MSVGYWLGPTPGADPLAEYSVTLDAEVDISRWCEIAMRTYYARRGWFIDPGVILIGRN